MGFVSCNFDKNSNIFILFVIDTFMQLLLDQLTTGVAAFNWQLKDKKNCTS